MAFKHFTNPIKGLIEFFLFMAIGVEANAKIAYKKDKKDGKI